MNCLLFSLNMTYANTFTRLLCMWQKKPKDMRNWPGGFLISRAAFLNDLPFGFLDITFLFHYSPRVVLNNSCDFSSNDRLSRGLHHCGSNC